jgi:hypothetical protein
MKKIYFGLLTIAAFSMVACGGAKKEDDKKDKKDGEDTEEPAEEEEAKVDYSYVIPKIDTAALTTETEILTAMQQVIAARKTDDSLTNVLPEYTGYYTELTNLYAAVLSKSNAYMNSLKGKEALEFNDKLTAVTDKMYEK